MANSDPVTEVGRVRGWTPLAGIVDLGKKKKSYLCLKLVQQ